MSPTFDRAGGKVDDSTINDDGPDVEAL